MVVANDGGQAMSFNRQVSLMGAAFIGVVLFSGCIDAGTFDKSGATGPTVLRMANGYSHLDFEPGVQAFVDAVTEVSQGELVVEVVSEWGDLPQDMEEQVVAAVTAGEADLGWAGSRVFDRLGVDAFAPLTAPLLIDSYELEDAVIESEVPADMLASLEELDLAGIAVLGGGLRKPITAAAPLIEAPDWSGVTFQAFPSNGHAGALRALGAHPTDVLWDVLDAGVLDGTIRGFEKNLRIVRLNRHQLIAPYITANVNLWPETSVVFANPGRMAQLTAAERDWLMDAGEMAARSSSELYDDQADLEFLCGEGARAATASPTQLDELRSHVAPVVDALRSGPSGTALERIEQLKSRTTAEPELEIPPGCAEVAAASR